MFNPITLINTAKRGNKLVNKTITNVNPEATDSELGKFLGAYNDLSEDKFVSANIVTRRELSISSAADMTVNPVSLAMNINASSTVTVTTASTGVITFNTTAHIESYQGGEVHPDTFQIAISGKTVTVYAPVPLTASSTMAEFSDTLVLNLAATDDYESATATVALTFNGNSGIAPGGPDELDIPTP